MGVAPATVMSATLILYGVDCFKNHSLAAGKASANHLDGSSVLAFPPGVS